MNVPAAVIPLASNRDCWRTPLISDILTASGVLSSSRARVTTGRGGLLANRPGRAKMAMAKIAMGDRYLYA